MSPHILSLDIAGAPHRWIDVRDARRRLQGVQQPQGRPHAGSSRYEVALRAIRPEPVRGLHPEQPQDPRRPDGVSTPARAEDLAAAPGMITAGGNGSACRVFAPELLRVR
jgi:hypothetical protein